MAIKRRWQVRPKKNKPRMRASTKIRKLVPKPKLR